MREASNVSPFAKLSSRAQKEQWICWQCQQDEPTLAEKQSVLLPPLTLPAEKETDFGQKNEKPTEVYRKQTEVCYGQPVHHSQYSAVIRRLKQAQHHAGAYASWST